MRHPHVIAIGWLATIVPAFALPSAATGATLTQQPATEDALRAYHTANGLMARGLHPLAEQEYRNFLSANPTHSKAPAARYGLALSLFKQGKANEAEREIRQVLDVRGFEFAAESRALLGQCLLALKRDAEAAEQLSIVVRDHSQHAIAPAAGAMAVEALHRAGKAEAAANLAADVRRRWPEHPLGDRVALFHGLSLMQQKQWPAAGACFEDAITSWPSSPLASHAKLRLAQCLHQSGELDRAARAYRECLTGQPVEGASPAMLGLAGVLHEQKSYAECGRVLDQLLTRERDDNIRRDATLLRARVWLDAGEPAKARDMLRPLVADAPNNVEESARADEVAYWYAKSLLRLDDAATAADVLATALAAHPQSPLLAEMKYDRGVALLRAGDAAGAAEAMRDFHSQHAAHALVAASLHAEASALRQLGRHDESLAAGEAFLREFAEHELAGDVAEMRAESLAALGRGDATGAFERLAHDSTDKARADRASLRLAALHMADGAPEKAEALLRPLARGRRTPVEHHAALLMLGIIAFDAGRDDEAQQMLTDYLALNPEASEADAAKLRLGLAHARRGKHAEALAMFDELLRAHPRSEHRVQAMFERGQALTALKRDDDARVAFEAVLREAEDSRFAAHARYHLGTLARATGDAEAALTHFEAAANAPALAGEARLAMADLLVQLGRHAQAQRVLDAVLSAEDTAIAAQAHARRAIAIARQGRHEEALSSLESAIAARELPPSLRDAVAYERAWTLRELGQLNEAREAFDRVRQSASSESLRDHAVVDIADLDARAEKHEAAAAALRELLRKPSLNDPSHAALRGRAMYLLGVSALRLERFDEAAEHMERFLAGASDTALTASACAIAGEAQFRLNRLTRAIELLRRVADEFPKDPAAPAAMLRLGESLAVLQRWAESERVFARFLSDHPASDAWPQARFGLGWAKENQGRHADAMNEYSQIVARHSGPTAARAQFQIGQCLFAAKRFDEAARELLRVDILYAYPDWSAAALYEAGRCFEAMNDLPGARQQYQQVIDRFGQSKWATLAAQRLASARPAPVPGR